MDLKAPEQASRPEQAGAAASAQGRSHWWHSADGGRLHATIWPGRTDRAPIIGLPGLHRNGRDFGRLAAWLEGERQLLGIDLRGRGLSDPDPDAHRYSIGTYIDDIDRLFDSLGIARAVLFGTSLGGVIAAIYAAQRPGQVAGLLYNDVAHRYEQAGLTRIRRQIGGESAWQGWQEAADALRDRYTAIHPRYTGEDWLLLARQALRQDPDGRIVPDFDPRIMIPLEQGDSPPSPDLLPVFTASREVPSLLLHGALSDLLSAATAAELAAALPSMELVTVPDVGHVPDLAEPASVAGIRRLLDRCA